ncbi:hypothetical protein QJS04_geneDACA000956 [Acorus gramineus]|uniref:Protein COFACTOR ASSEMBLY OF COMPLEX C SUBUNIT B CCB2, chloroplastic n=1 Tax=Acorus gramineus TaxID=55184 RepID=A0AAV9AEP8_ACOGR|nr:hypothetical protein QJS04_geneDACA000956 [Acorus gramineus]
MWSGCLNLGCTITPRPETTRRVRPHRDSFTTLNGASLRVNKSRRVFSARLDGTEAKPSNQPQQLNLSVLRFTFGIPGLDESYLPRWIGLGFGSLILLNHFFSPSSPAQLRSESIGIGLAVFSYLLPYLGKFLEGANPVERASLPEGNRQIFLLPEDISDYQKEDLAWGSYVLLQNTNSMSLLISVENSLCVRGYWNSPENASKDELLNWFEKQTQQIGFSDLNDTLYIPQYTDSQASRMLPKGTCSLLVQPFQRTSDKSAGSVEKNRGFILLASSVRYAYSDRDRAWIRAVANKFIGFHSSRSD